MKAGIYIFILIDYGNALSLVGDQSRLEARLEKPFTSEGADRAVGDRLRAFKHVDRRKIERGCEAQLASRVHVV